MNLDITTSPVDVGQWASSVIQRHPADQAMIWCPSGGLRHRVELQLLDHQIDLNRVKVLTPFSLARSASTTTVIDSTQRARLLASFLTSPHIDLGSTVHGLLETPFGIAEVAAAIDQARMASVGRDEILVHAEAHSHAGWAEIGELVDRWTDWLRLHHVNDQVGCQSDYAQELRSEHATTSWWAATQHVLVVQVDRLPALAIRMLTALMGPNRAAATTSITLQGLDHGPTVGSQAIRRWKQQVQPEFTETVLHPWQDQTTLVQVGHPAMEAEAVTSELLKLHQSGRPWHSLFVAAPTTRHRLRNFARAANRAGIPIAGAPPPRLDGPIVEALIASGDLFEGLLSPPVFVTQQVNRLLPDLALRENEVIDVVLGLIRHAEQHEALQISDWLLLLDSSPYAPVVSAVGLVDAVTLSTLEDIGDAMYGVVDPVVLIVGCVEGELPSRPSRGSFETYVLDGPTQPSEHLGGHLANERWNLERVAVVASSIMLFAAPDAGVLVSRFAEGLNRQQPTWPARVLDRDRWDASLSTTTNETPLVPEQRLTLSATQLTMFENCPWQYTVQYRLRVRSEGGVAARFGSYVHDVLETFLAPLARIPALHGTDQHPAEQEGFDSPEVAFAFTHTFEGLLALAKHRWTDDIIDHPSQGDDFRRRALDQFTGWWEREGQRLVTSNEVAFVEYPFDIAIGQHRLKGFIDRIDQTARNGVAIIDYKTGAAKTQAQVGDDLQLAVYHLAAVSDPDLTAIGPVESLTLNYLKDSRSVSQPIVEGHELVTYARIHTLIDEILEESHDPSTHANCDYCDLHRVCDLQLAGRPVPIAFNRRSAIIKVIS